MCAVRSVLQCVVACCSDVALSAVSTSRTVTLWDTLGWELYMQYAAGCSVLQCVAVCCSVLQ